MERRPAAECAGTDDDDARRGFGQTHDGIEARGEGNRRDASNEGPSVQKWNRVLTPIVRG
jgi:hypothetical protein